jgi:hypothetical protein
MVYVSDGYGQTRVHRFSSEGVLLGSWKPAGRGPGQFTLSHHVSGDGKGGIFACDRESKRVQLFDETGTYRDEFSARFWPGLEWPNAACVDPSRGGAHELAHHDAGGAVAAAGALGRRGF